jgi:hypothetical protein
VKPLISNWAMTGGICVNFSTQVGGSAGVGGCLLVDGDGFGWMGTAKAGGGPAVSFPGTAEIGLIASSADRMEDLRGRQVYVGGTFGEGAGVGGEVDTGGDVTLQAGVGATGFNVSPFGPVSVNGGVAENWVDRWDWASWG